MSRGHGVVELARAIREGRAERMSGALALHVVDLMASLQASTDHRQYVELSTTVDVVEPLPETWDPLAATL